MANVIQIVITAIDAASAEIKGVEAATAKLSGALNGLAKQLLSPVGVAAGVAALGFAAVEMANHFAHQVKALENLSEVTHLGINDLRTFQTVMREAGKSPDSLNNALFILRRNMENNSAPLRKIIGDTTDTAEALRKLSAAAAGSGNSAAIAMAAFGRGGRELAPILATLNERLGDAHGRMVQLGPDALAAAEQYHEAMEKIKTSVGELGIVVGPVLAKSMLLSIGLITAGVKMMKGDIVQSLSEIIRAVANVAGQVIPGPDKKPTGAAGPAGPVRIPGILEGLRIGNPVPSAGNRELAADLASQEGGLNAVLAETNRRMAAFVAGLSSAVPHARVLSEGINRMAIALHDFADESISVIAGSFSQMFDAVLVQGQSFVKSLGDMLKNIASQIASIAVQMGVGFGLTALGTAVGGPLGGIVGAIGGKLAGAHTVVNITAMDARSLVEQIKTPVGSWSRAQNRAAIGTSY